MKQLFCLLLFLLVYSTSFGQKRVNNWVFEASYWEVESCSHQNDVLKSDTIYLYRLGWADEVDESEMSFKKYYWSVYFESDSTFSIDNINLAKAAMGEYPTVTRMYPTELTWFYKKKKLFFSAENGTFIFDVKRLSDSRYLLTKIKN